MSLLFSADSGALSGLRRRSSIAVSVAAAACLLAPLAHGQSVGRIIDEQGSFDQGSRESQARVTRYAQQTSELLGEYRVTLQQLDRVNIYNNNLQAIVNDQQESIDQIRSDLEGFEQTEQGIVPLMMDMIADLKAFIEADIPFNLNNRLDVVARLQDNMTNSDLAVQERYRQIVEAYKTEAAFGRNIETYEGNVTIDGVDTTVDFLRLGRVVLAYQTKDQAVTGVWNTATRQWEVVSSSYRRAVADGISQARKEAPPNLMVLPVPGAEAAQ